MGPFSGYKNLVGNLVGTSWRGLDIVKGRPRISGKAKTQAQLDQQAKFRLVTQALAPLGPTINLGFKSFDKISTQMNAAVRYNLEHGVIGASPNFTFDYTKLQFSYGTLLDGNDTAINTIPGSKMRFFWPTLGLPDECLTDKATVVVYAPAIDRWAKLENAAYRTAGEFTLQMTAAFMGQEVMCFICFISSKNPSKASMTNYLGTIEAQ